MGSTSIALATLTFALSTSVNAVVLNTLNGDDYEWLELTATVGLSRDSIEQRFTNVNDELYGYEYASRQLVEELFLSYAAWDGLDGWHGAPSAVAGIDLLMQDFGVTDTYTNTSIYPNGGDLFGTVDGYTFEVIERWAYQWGMYGSTDECESGSCLSLTQLRASPDEIWAVAFQSGIYGFDAQEPAPVTVPLDFSGSKYGSYLVRSATIVPVPTAAWLFGSGLIGLIGIARRKKVNCIQR